MSSPVRFGVVGTGWRAEYFVRLGRLLPDRLEVAGVVARRPERAVEVAAAWDVPVFPTTAALVADAGPDFVISSVPWEANPGVVEELVGHGIAVLSETPPAPDESGLAGLWARVGGSGLVQVAEQYMLMPMHAARLAAVRSGLLGTVSSVQVSSTHQYHAVSMIRGFLGAGHPPAVVDARRFRGPLVDPLTRGGWTGDATPKEATTTLATFDFGPAGTGVYDFTDNQWHNRLRGRRLVIRGSHGEIVDHTVTRLRDTELITDSPLLRRQSGYDLDLEGYDTDHIQLDGELMWVNPYSGHRLADEEIAILTLLDATASWRRGAGPAPYPLADACTDHLLALAVETAATKGVSVDVEPGPWA
ncbi:Gfo/Idh/MocA family oxidoreductase [Pseudonocardia sp. NPDC049635]|uniref:Gfo/Idh/MocA family protein n=1 Tax=Pseudonocardia sp. NPDC049635 TaxID=3155506 RepID=UPI0033CA5F0B